jgi:polar amino acid transport system substrate-binding protein
MQLGMRRLLLALVLILMVLPLVPAAAQDALPDLGGRTIKVATENAYIPFGYINETTGEAEGWNYDAINEICVRLNCVPEYIETSWDGMLVAISAGEFDVAGDGITITDERKEVVDFSDGYIAVEQVILARVDEDRFSSGEELAANPDLRLGSQSGTTNYETSIALVGEDRVQVFETFGVVVQALLAGDVDAVVIDNVAGQGYVGVNADQIKIVGEPIVSDQLGFAFPKGSDLVAPFNAALAALRADGTLVQINGKWFPPTLPNLNGRSITVAVENAYQPFNFINEQSGKPEGWDYDMLAEICTRLNCVPEFVETSWDGMIIAVSNGEYDMAADGITITEERKQQVNFSIGYIQVEQVLLVRSDESRFSTVQELVDDPNMRVGSQPGTTNYEVAAKLLGEDRIQAYETFPVAVQALISGDVDAVIMDNVAGQGYVGVNSDKVRLIDTTLKSDALGFIYPLGSDLVKAFDAALISMMNDGALDAINAKWFPPAQ